MKVLVAGAGVAGLSAALALRARGVDVEVFEARPAFRHDEGLFLTVAENGLRVLAQLGLLESVLATNPIPTPEIVFESATGRVLGTAPNGSLEDGTPSFTLMRATLVETLTEAARSRGIPVAFGEALERVEPRSGGVRAHFSGGAVRESCLLVGADGIRSVVREYVAPSESGPRYTGLVNLGGVCPEAPIPATPGHMRMLWGHRAFFGVTVRTRGEAFWFANLGAAREPTREDLARTSSDTWKARLAELFRDDPAWVRRVIEATPTVRGYPIHDLDPPSQWRRGRVILIGDAAHAVAPSSGQGASLALEDGIELAREVSGEGTTTEALDRFVTLRRPRAERMVAEGRKRGAYKAPRTRLSRWVRDLVLPLVLRKFLTPDRLAWIHGYRARWPSPAREPTDRSGPSGSLCILFLLVALAGCASGPNAPGAADFQVPLSIPHLLEGTVDAEGRRVFELEAREGVREFRSGLETETKGINAGHLGPTLRARRGEPVRVRLTNRLDEATTLHWHGMELPPSMDGGPHQMVAPGETWSPEWTVDQPAATLWYHPHPHGATERQVYSGMAGFFLLDDDATDGLALPTEYGVDDLPLLIQDIRLDSEGGLIRHVPWYNQVGPLGDLVLVNGALTPYVDVHRTRTRLRFLNASSSRVFNLGFTDGRSFVVVGTDGGLLAAPHPTNRVQLSPGERAEIVVELSPGDTTVLRSFEQTLGTDFLNHRWAGGNDRFDLLELRAGPDLEPSPELPTRLAHLPEPDLAAVDTTRSFQVSSRAINGRVMDMNRIDALVRPGSVEIWKVEGIAVPHNLHLHGVQFRILDVDGTPPNPLLEGWKDTVYLMPDRVTRILIEFPDMGDDPTPFMFHCHFLRHEDDGAMGQFQLTWEGDGPAAPLPSGVLHERPDLDDAPVHGELPGPRVLFSEQHEHVEPGRPPYLG